MQAIAAADRADLPLCKETGGGHRTECILQAAGVVARLVKQPSAPTVAAEDEGAGRNRTAVFLPGQQRGQVVVRALRVADVELDRLARADEVTHRDHARIRVGADDVADQKIPPLIMVLVFVGHATDMERVFHKQPVGGIEFTIDLPQPFERGPSSQFDDHVLLRFRDHHRPTDRAAALRHDRADPRGPTDDEAHGARVVGTRARDERVAAGLKAAAGHAAHDRHAGMVFLDPLDQRVDRKRERVCQQHDRGIVGPDAVERGRPAGEHSAVGGLRVFEGKRDHAGTGQPRQPDGHDRA